MKKYKGIVLFLLLFLLFFCINAGVIQSTPKDSVWEKFISNPNQENYEQCRIMVADSLNGPYKDGYKTQAQQTLLSNSRLYEKYLKLVSKGDPYAVELAFQMYPLPNGGDGERLFIAIGEMSNSKPSFFLSVLKKYNITDKRVIEAMIATYPMERVVDNLEREIMLTGQRVSVFERVVSPELKGVRDQCIKILSVHIINLNNIRDEQLKSNN